VLAVILIGLCMVAVPSRRRDETRTAACGRGTRLGYGELVPRPIGVDQRNYTAPPRCGPVQYSGSTCVPLASHAPPAWDDRRVPAERPVTPCCADDYDLVFDRHEAVNDLEQWRRHGPAPATRQLIDALEAEGIAGARLLDVGAGVGAVHLELLERGAGSAIDVDLSRAFLEVAGEEAERRGMRDRVEHRHGDFVTLAEDLPDAEIVTLDRVVCCYPDLSALLREVARRSTRLIGIVHPWDAWPMRAGMTILNLARRPFRGGCSFFVHRRATMDRLLADAGFTGVFRGGTWFWRVAVYRRV